jgi:toxin-antitoxin system PIN domain toxin
VILVDANILVYSHAPTYPQHEKSRIWLDQQLNGTTRVGLPWVSLLGFVRLVSNQRIFAQPASVAEAWSRVARWLDCEPAWIPEPTPRHAEVLGTLMTSAGMTSALVSDAHLAALAIEHGLILCSADGDFARFPGLRWHNPLTA